MGETGTTGVVGFSVTVLPGGVGSIFAPAFVHNNTYEGVLQGATPGTSSVLALTGLEAGLLNENPDFPAYYLEVLNDTNASDGFDTEGLILDIISNTSDSITIAHDSSAFGVQGNEAIAIRKHVTLSDVFKGSTGLTPYTDPVTIYDAPNGVPVPSYVPNANLDG